MKFFERVNRPGQFSGPWPTRHTGKTLDIWSTASFGLCGRKVYFEVLWTMWSKDRVISGLKTAQNLNFKVRNPLKMINFMSKWTPIYTMFWRFFDFWSLKWKLCFLYMILEIKLFFIFLLRISANLQKCWENHTKSKFLGCAGPSRW